MLQTVVAMERDGWDVRTLTLLFEVPDEHFNLEYWVRKAATDYCLTEKGRAIYDYNCSCFNWADFDMNVPNEFCEKYGFKKINTGIRVEFITEDDYEEEDYEEE